MMGVHNVHARHTMMGVHDVHARHTMMGVHDVHAQHTMVGAHDVHVMYVHVMCSHHGIPQKLKVSYKAVGKLLTQIKVLCLYR